MNNDRSEWSQLRETLVDVDWQIRNYQLVSTKNNLSLLSQKGTI